MKGTYFGRVLKVSNPVLCAVSVLMAAVLAVSAWYITMINKLTRTGELDIDMPPIIYIKDDNLQEITSFQLDGLKIGEEYNAVFCVSPAVPGSVNNFFLGVIYTENLGMEISLYSVDSVTKAPMGGEDVESESRVITSGNVENTYYFNYKKSHLYTETFGDWSTVSRPASANLNTGVYRAYRDLKFSDKAPDSNTDPMLETLNDQRQYRFFVLNITWKENTENAVNNENAKEADIVYIVSKGTRKNDT